MNRSESLLPLEVFFFFDFYFSWIYLILGLFIYIFKSASLNYPPSTLAPEVVGLLLMTILQQSRIKIGNNHEGSLANKTESSKAALWLVALGITNIVATVFYLRFQTFV